MTAHEDDPSARPHRSHRSDLLDAFAPITADDVQEAVDCGDALEALRRATIANDLDTATDVVRLCWFDLLRDEVRPELRPLLDGIPRAQLEEHPLLATLHGLTADADELRTARALQHFARTATTGRRPAEGASTAEQALALAGESVGLRLLGKPAMAVEPARAGLDLLDTIRAERSTLIGFLPRVYAHLGTSLYYGGHGHEALDAFSSGYAEAGTSDRSSFANLSMMAGAHALDGNFTEAAEYVRMSRGEPWTDEQRATYWGTFYRLAEALLALERFDLGEAQRHLDEMDHDRRSIEHWVAIARVEAKVGLVSGDASGALARLEAFADLRGAEGRSAASRQQLASIRVLLHLALGDLEAARSIVQRDAPPSARTLVDRARIALVAGQPSEAVRELRPLAGTAQSPAVTVNAASLEAAAALRPGPGRPADPVVRRLGAHLRQSGQRTPMVLLQSADLVAIRTRGIELGYADVFGSVPSAGSVLADPVAPPRLTPRERAVLDVLARESSTAQIARELFVSVNTVKSQLRSIYRKLGVNSRDEALMVSRELGIPSR